MNDASSLCSDGICFAISDADGTNLTLHLCIGLQMHGMLIFCNIFFGLNTSSGLRTFPLTSW
jgi:hypothetical protein